MSGQWRNPSDEAALTALADLDIRGPEASRIIAALGAARVLVRERYYVPDFSELLGTYRTIAYRFGKNMSEVGLRWVMCRETHDALVEQFSQTRAAPPPTFSLDFWKSAAGEELPITALELEIHWVMEAQRR